MKRPDGRDLNQIRPATIEIGVLRNAEGSAQITVGETVILCAATVEERLPGFLKGKGKGWVTAEYGMLPRSTNERMTRESVQGRQGGRTMEIQRLIGRSLRAVMDLESLGERTIVVDCDVLEADGGTRTASVTGGCVALHQALTYLVEQQKIPYHPMRELVSAISVGMLGSDICLDLCYQEDARSDVDLNVVITGSKYFVEVQGTAEGRPFSHQNLLAMLESAAGGCGELNQIQRTVLDLTEESPDS